MDPLTADIERTDREIHLARMELARVTAQIAGLEAVRRVLTEQADRYGTQRHRRRAHADDLRDMTKDRAIVEVLRAAIVPMRIQQIVDALHRAGRDNENYNGISVYLDTLLKQGRVRRVARGLYTAV